MINKILVKPKIQPTAPFRAKINNSSVNKNWKRILLLSASLLIYNVHGQTSDFQTKTIDIKSPQSYEMERFGNTPVNLYSGSVDVSVPVYSTEIPGTGENFNINLAYNSSGFIPAKQSNYVGLDWFLNYGGAITRTIRNFPDDVKHSQFTEGDNTGGGYLAGARAVAGLGLTNQDIFDIQYPRTLLHTTPPYTYFPYLSPEQKIARFYELEPDKFNFNFMGVSGYFYIGIDLKPVAVSNDPNLKIDITGLSIQADPNGICKPDPSQIVITDGKGNKYYFGGDTDNLEISYDLGLLGETPMYTPFYNVKIMSWYLTKVEYMNGRKIVIENKKYGSDWTTFCHGNYFPPRDLSENPNGLKQAFFDLNFYVSGKREIKPAKTMTNYYAGPENEFKGGTSMNVVKKVFPEKITIDNVATILFNYTEFPAYTSYVDHYGSPFAYGYKSLKLNKVSVYNNQNKEVKAVNFSYNRVKDYFFLSSVVDGDQKYSFDYYKTSNLPEHTTHGIDFWGYWNGKPENNYLTPSYVFNNSSLTSDIVGDQRNPNPELYDVALLRKIDYPTGGYSSFYYEPHAYSKTIWRDINSHFLQYLKNQAGTTGGARIKKIIDFDGKNQNIRDFNYDKDADDGSISGKSSGINNSFFSYVYLDYPQLDMILNPVLNIVRPTEYINSLNPNTYTSNPVNYSQVNEWVNNKLYKKSYFSDIEGIPDALPDKVIKKEYISSTIPDFEIYRNLTLPYVDYGYYRGKLLKINYMGEQGIPVKTVESQYNTIKLQNKDQFVTWGSFEHLMYNRYYKINLNQQRLTSTTTTDFLNGNIIKTKTDYSYDTNLTNNLLSKESTSTDQAKLKTIYKYANDIPGSTDLIQKNLLSIPLETTTYKNDIPVSKTKMSYSSNWSGHTTLLPKQVQSILLNTINSSSETSENEMVYDQYDIKGNLLQYHTKSGINVSVVWGYNQTLPIAKIEGIDYLSLLALPGMANIITDLQTKSVADIDDITEQALSTALDNFRKNPSLANYQTTTYTHNPLIGVSSITPSSGIREVYKYNASTNKLEKVVSKENELLREYQYKFQQPASGLFYNDEVSGYFIKNNCPNGLVGDRYLYVVPEKKYSSTISKDDAYFQALADLKNNGQSQANLSGNCIPATCTFSSSDAIPYWSVGISKISSSKVQLTFDGIFIADDLVVKTILSQGVKVGKITGGCVPATQRYGQITSRNRVWNVSVEPNGDIFLKFLYENAANSPSSIVNFTFIYDLFYYSTEQKQGFIRNNCPSGTTATMYTYVVPANTYTSEISVSDANNKALNDINMNGQNSANTNSVCLYFNTEKSQTFTKTCPPGGLASYTYIVPAQKYSSDISQADADQKALDEINTNGQTKANAIPCFYSAEKSKTFIKNCPPDAVSNTYTYVVEAKKYSSDISQADADQKAIDDINANGQIAANSNPCVFNGCDIASLNGITLGASAFVTQPSSGHFKANISMIAPNNLNWYSNSMANIPSTCRPNSTRVIENVLEFGSKTLWRVTINTNGNIVLTPSVTDPGPTHGGMAVAGKGASFSFEYDR
ncbi:hypothetical protein F3J23_16855 [Chryseobacterium sp. Tr-659]|uniref:DUF5977 domain-containing protein n=1 Tax=Chryseobacterium sp. Tr-659 TaxID=2608340 RepID=UPI001424A107|nr:DUF5977 domain-containing protein [Chryseobacterium sp. Tr-659]NIF07109.1 hypothetical protein [Chryseobacterium sp. Tr-659]